MRVTIQPGQKVRTVGVYSEIMMHFRLAGRPVEVELLRREYPSGVYYMAQIYHDGEKFSGPITTSEAGIIENGDEFTIDANDGPGDEDPAAVQREFNQMIREAMSGPGVCVITNLGL